MISCLVLKIKFIQEICIVGIKLVIGMMWDYLKSAKVYSIIKEIT